MMIELDFCPHFAPLSRPELEYAATLLLGQRPLPLTASLTRLTDQFQDAWSTLTVSITSARAQVYEVMTPAVEEHSLSTEWVIAKLAEFSPQARRISAETISRWRENNLLHYEGKNRPRYDSTAALLMLRLIANESMREGKGKQRTQVITKWAPTQKIDAEEPRWWCYRQDFPHTPVLACPIPLPQDIPHHALLWTNWLGASWEDTWLPVGDDGAARWAGTYHNNQRLYWEMTEEDVHMWDPEISPLGKEVLQSAVPATLNTLATLAILRLATSRLQEAQRTLSVQQLVEE